MRVLKFPFDIRDPDVRMPRNANIIMVAHEPGQPRWRLTLWAECFDAPVEKRQIAVFGTGQPIQKDDSLTHVGSVLISDEAEGQLVWHVYEWR